MTKIITFYSYKGGVGRTMALVNTAHVLARDGWRVLMVDFDLEAPGMTHFFAELVRDRPQTVERDALDLLLHAKRNVAVAGMEKAEPGILRSLSEYVISVKLPDEWLEERDSGIPYRNGRLDFLPATLEPVEAEEPPESEPTRDYLARMDELDLAGIFAVDGPRHHFGHLVRQYFLNARFQATGDVLFCYFMEKAGLLDRKKAKPFAVVAGPVPVWHTRQSDERVALMRKELGAERIVEVPYHPAAALEETVFVRQEPKEPISKAYEELAPVLAGLASGEGQDTSSVWSRRLVKEAMHGDEQKWSEVSREVAKRLPQYRLDQESHRAIRPVAFLASFPSACTMSVLPRKSRKGLGWSDLVPITLAAAISAHRLKSDRPFRRCWELVSTTEHEQVARDLAVRLVFLQLRTLGTCPKEDLWEQALQSAIKKVGDLKEEGGYREESESIFLQDALVTALLLRGYERESHLYLPEDVARKGLSILSGNSGRIRELLYHRPGPMRMFHRMMEMEPEFLDGLYPQAFFALSQPAVGEADKAALVEIADKARLPIPGKRFLGPHFPVSPKFFHPGLLEDMLFDRERGDMPVPLGFWPELTIATAVAVVKGSKGIKDILGWLSVARLSYGYAWRVLVDWRHLEQVKGDPAFVEFLRKEDQQAEAIESAIDSGEYPL
jgi:hypothetical protein